MGKYKWTTGETPFAEVAAELADRILLHSKDRVLQVKGSFAPEHKAYTSLALAAAEAIRAFVALDEGLK